MNEQIYIVEVIRPQAETERTGFSSYAVFHVLEKDLVPTLLGLRKSGHEILSWELRK